jgi:hypothetical protein
MPCVVSAFLILAAPAVAGDGGGVSAPAAAPAAETSAAAAPAPAEGAQDDTPTTPEGEEQPPDEEGGDTPTDDGGGGGGGDVVDLPLDGADEGNESAAGEALPRSGFEAFALGAIGLGLLLAGAALRPTSSWPPPRDRLSRSTLRR